MQDQINLRSRGHLPHVAENPENSDYKDWRWAWPHTTSNNSQLSLASRTPALLFYDSRRCSAFGFASGDGLRHD